MIIFLDFDGVLVTSRANVKPGLAREVDPDAVAALHYLLSHLDNPEVVVSSSWRIGSTVEKMQKQLDDWGVKCKVIGLTPVCGMTGRRDHEIYTWLHKNGDTEAYIVVDDEYCSCTNITPEKFLYVKDGWEEAGLTIKMVDNFLHWRKQNERKD